MRVHVAESVASTIALYRGLVGEQAWTRPVSVQLGLQAERLLDGHRQCLPGAFVELSNWLPELVGCTAEWIWMVNLSLDDALRALAHQHGYVWPIPPDRASALPVAMFERAVEAVVDGELDVLEELFHKAPELGTMTSHFGHRATLLHYVAANGVETYRQRVPSNAVAVAEWLVSRGADVAATASMYGGRQTALGLVLTSAHPAEAGLTDELAKVLSL